MSQQYPLVSVNRDGSQTSYVYRAANDTVPDVAARLSNQRKPQQMSETDPDHMFLVYSNEWYHLQRDADKPSDTLIEVDSKDFVRRNYNPSFLEGYVAASLIGHLFDSIGNYGKYRGYTGRNVYKPSDGSYRAPTQNDQKAAPPLTVPGKGFITKRGSGSVKDRPGDTGGLFDREPATSGNGSKGSISRGGGSSYGGGSKGSISRGGGASSGSGGAWLSPRKSSPRTSFGGSGRISRRRR